jgi:Glucoamylase and related glycosyl hydrolases
MSEPTYNAIEDYGLVGDMHTCALISKAGSLDYMCWPVFDSPTVFCRLLDDKKGGFFSVKPYKTVVDAHSKQRYFHTRTYLKPGGPTRMASPHC